MLFESAQKKELVKSMQSRLLILVAREIMTIMPNRRRKTQFGK